MSCVKKAEPVEMLFGVWTRVFDGGTDPHKERERFFWRGIFWPLVKYSKYLA